MKHGSSILCLAVLLAGSTGAFAVTRYVSLDGQGTSPYTDWSAAATSITLAASVSVNGDLIVVSNGVYPLSDSQYIRTAPLLTVSGLYSAAETILDGGGKAFAGIQVGWGCMTAHVYNLTVRNCRDRGVSCNANEVYLYNCVVESNSAERGGGVNVANGGRVYITNCVIRNNKATIASHYAGGGIYVAGAAAKCKVFNSAITDNLATNGSYGGGVYADGSNEFHGCFLSGNQGNIGGGICAGASATFLYVSGCTVTLNSAASGGGLHDGLGKLTVCDSTITSNTASQGGGVYGGSLVSNCLVVGNTAGNVGGGCRSTYMISHCTFQGNVATNGGGGLYLPAIVRNCLLVNNRASGGGGINASGTLIQNCTIVSNFSTGNGGGIAGSGSCTNSIVYFNAGAGAFSNYQTMAFSYSCTAPLPAGVGNIPGDPRFAGFAAGDFRPVCGSPCINSGTNDPAWMFGGLDLDGRARIREAVVDMGAYEFIPPGTVFSLR